MSDLLVLASDVALRGANLDYAATLAAILPASLSALYVVPPCPREYDFAPASLAGEIIAFCRQQRERAATAACTFADWTTRRRLGAGGWCYTEAETVDALAQAAMWYDAFVLPRDDRVSWSDAARTLVRADVPCFVVPEQCTEFRLDTIAIAWNGSPQATRALHSSLPLLQKALRVVLIDGSSVEPLPGARAADPACDIDSYLRNHCANVTRVAFADDPDNTGAGLLAVAADAAADLLVMGAYGQTRFGEWVFGGATRHVLEHAALPLLLRH